MLLTRISWNQKICHKGRNTQRIYLLFFLRGLVSLAQTPGPDLALKEWVYIYGYRNLYKA